MRSDSWSKVLSLIAEKAKRMIKYHVSALQKKSKIVNNPKKREIDEYRNFLRDQHLSLFFSSPIKARLSVEKRSVNW